MNKMSRRALSCNEKRGEQEHYEPTKRLDIGRNHEYGCHTHREAKKGQPKDQFPIHPDSVCQWLRQYEIQPVHCQHPTKAVTVAARPTSPGNGLRAMARKNKE
jgi:hypothetical protein